MKCVCVRTFVHFNDENLLTNDDYSLCVTVTKDDAIDELNASCLRRSPNLNLSILQENLLLMMNDDVHFAIIINFQPKFSTDRHRAWNISFKG